MSQEDSQQEPTMEEILASIRRIISEDEEEQEGSLDQAVVAPEGFEAESGAEQPPADDEIDMESVAADVMENVVDDEIVVAADDDFESVESLADEPMTEDDEIELPEPVQDDDVLELIDRVEEEEPVAVVQEETFEESVEFVEEDDDVLMVDEDTSADEEVEDATLISPDAAVAAAASFGSLAQNIAIANGQSRTLEALVQEMLKPILKDWLDTNLPTMVEELVREEIARIAKRTGKS